MIKCAFDIKEGKCSALNVKNCKGCRFFKSKERLIEGRKKAAKRVQSLPERQRAYIYEHYARISLKGNG
jgi:hypothetical protein